jgi:protoheme IX farnesyltransferase
MTALVLEGSLLSQPLYMVLAAVALYLTGGSANALNQCFEHEIDARMTRTTRRRPLPQKRISLRNAYIFSITIGATGVLMYGFFFNWFSALLSLGTILFYSLFYTLFLKPNTSQNIVIGGAAGAMAPVGTWVAATGTMALDPWILFMIIFLWTPPHFWALALVYKEDYRNVNLPMLPVKKGDEETLKQIFFYSIALFVISLILIMAKKIGILYIVTASVLGGIFVLRSFQAKKSKNIQKIRQLFGYSIAYLFGLFFVIILDGLI